MSNNEWKIQGIVAKFHRFVILMILEEDIVIMPHYIMYELFVDKYFKD